MTTHVLQTLPPLTVGAQQPATIDPTLDLCTWYPLWLGGLRQCGVQSLPDTSSHGQHWELNPRPGIPDLLILSLIPYLLGHVLQQWTLDISDFGPQFIMHGCSKLVSDLHFNLHICDSTLLSLWSLAR